MSYLKKIIKNALGVSETTKELASERLEICNQCPNNDKGICKICGCFLDIKTALDYNRNPKKAGRIEKTHCPEGNWPFIDDDGIKHDNDLVLANYYKYKSIF